MLNSDLLDQLGFYCAQTFTQCLGYVGRIYHPEISNGQQTKLFSISCTLQFCQELQVPPSIFFFFRIFASAIVKTLMKENRNHTGFEVPLPFPRLMTLLTAPSYITYKGTQDQPTRTIAVYKLYPSVPPNVHWHKGRIFSPSHNLLDL